jgi:U3 small nucleolar RNA-associated protein 14
VLAYLVDITPTSPTLSPRREREAAAKARRDKDLKFVVLSERFDKKAYTKYSTAALPYPFKSQEVYEASIRQVGDWVGGGHA